MNGSECELKSESRGRRVMRWSLSILCGVVCLSSIAPAQSKDSHADDPISVVLEPIQFPPRTATFYPVTCTVTNRTKGLWEGSLRLRQLEELPTDFELIIPDLVVGSDPLEFTITLPPLLPNSLNQQTELQAHSIDKYGHTEELPKIQLISYTSNIRTMTFGVCVPVGASDIPGDVRPLITPLQLFDNGAFKAIDNRTVRVSAPTVVSTELSEQPLDYVRFDGLMLTKMSIEQLRPKQCAAIEGWVRAGGTLAVCLPSQMDAEHVEFLNRLIQENGTKLENDSEKGLISDRELDEPLISSYGLGQTVLISEKYLQDRAEDKEELTRLAREVWRTMPDFEARINSYTTDLSRLSYQLQQQQMLRSGQRLPMSTIVHQGSNAPQYDALIFDLLKPKNMGVIPIELLILSLVAYILLIGPGDYFVLGWFKARRFTWILFPLVTICFSWGMLRLTNYVMGTNNRISKIRIVDLDQEGKVLRENDLSLLMFSTPKRERIDMGSGYVTRLQSTPTGFDQPGYDSRRWASRRPRYIGRVPSRYTVEIDAEQWNPERYRTVRFTSTDPVPEFPWKKYVESELLKSVSGDMALREEFQRDLVRAFGDTASANVFVGGMWRTLTHKTNSGEVGFSESRALTEFSSMTPKGEFSWLRRVSPQATDSYDDLSLLEAEDNRHSVLGIIVHKGEDLVLYRVLIRRVPTVQPRKDIPPGFNVPRENSQQTTPAEGDEKAAPSGKIPAAGYVD